MMPKSPTRTFARLHFEDLSHTRFEDLCVQFFYPLKEWTSFHHWGRKGKDRGVDIHAEFIEEEVLNTWAIQCKRHAKMTLSAMIAIVTGYLKQNPGRIPDCYWLLLACDVSRNATEGFMAHCRKVGLKDVRIVSSSVLEAELYARYPGLLYTFFNISANTTRIQTIARVRRRLAMKRKVEREYFSGPPRGGSDAIIHDVHRDNYPDPDIKRAGISPWFKLEYFQRYHRGLSFRLNVVRVRVERDGSWQIMTEKAPASSSSSTEIHASVVGDIPYDNIVEIDPGSDEYTNGAHFYCEFANGGTPYERIWYDPIEHDKDRVLRLPEEKRIRNQR